MPDLCFGVFHTSQMQKQLVEMGFYSAAVFCSPVCENLQECHFLRIIERQPFFCNRCQDCRDRRIHWIDDERHVLRTVDFELIFHRCLPRDIYTTQSRLCNVFRGRGSGQNYSKLIEECGSPNCALHEFRFGTNPNKKTKTLTREHKWALLNGRKNKTSASTLSV